MKIADLWRTSDAEWRSKKVEQMVAVAGSGNLTDDSAASKDFRDLLSIVDLETLRRYATECLTSKAKDSGLILQDVVNAIGARLGFSVQYGRYQGTVSHIGFDGLWQVPGGGHIVIECKTTDAYRIPLDRADGYRQKLVADGAIQSEASSILYIVGRADTGDLEAQIRGSRHAWTMRLISIDALCKLLMLSENLESAEDRRKVFEVLRPLEYTKVDAIIDLVFRAQEAVDARVNEGDLDEGQSPKKRHSHVDFNLRCAARVEKTLKITLVQSSRAQFASPDDLCRVVVAVSKTYEGAGFDHFWFAFHPHYETFLERTTAGYLALGCGSEATTLLIPFNSIRNVLPFLNKTQLPDRYYHHIKIVRRDDNFTLRTRRGQSEVNVSEFLIGADRPGP